VSKRAPVCCPFHESGFLSCSVKNMAALAPTRAPLEVRSAGPDKGRGVFATAAIVRGMLLEEVPVLVLSAAEYAAFGKHTLLAHYTFNWQDGGQALALGLCGSMWNHRRPPNVGYTRNFAEATIRFVAMTDIAAGEECCIDYGLSLWFFDASSVPAGEESD